ncbi:putative ATP-dependent RNA helicase prh1 [Neolecta irregularis DAH-3]|uniref:RNA helicase n=1 Tax=Neolecta irregularis (strain DAH-3) TaxID=1198029 RepID=A0A1U7LS33_NEOID|nr:putative ATP-dependent RNA helicase prh1 [Neolecta irregularis DAH-3]|eukprot:OLL25393.1 putative ATP-dependent RNA helicase prh1 [Neolecta irregularis DAH-3]
MREIHFSSTLLSSSNRNPFHLKKRDTTTATIAEMGNRSSEEKVRKNEGEKPRKRVVNFFGDEDDDDKKERVDGFKKILRNEDERKGPFIPRTDLEKMKTSVCDNYSTNSTTFKLVKQPNEQILNRVSDNRNKDGIVNTFDWGSKFISDKSATTFTKKYQPPVPNDTEWRSLKETAKKLKQEREKLPIWSAQASLIEKLESSQVIIILGETGSGKSTQIPQFLLKASFAQKGVIGITQPRRVAAITLAKRVSQEQATKLGDKVGYSIRFDDKTCFKTRIKYLTDGMLLRELIVSNDLKGYNSIILDEAHERTLLTDLLLGFLKNLMKRRKEFRVVVMSATIQGERYSKFFDEAEVCFVEGRQFPVDVYHSVSPEKDYCDALLRTVFQIHVNMPPGDILVFLTGQDEIENLEGLIVEYGQQLSDDCIKILPLPLFASLSQSKQMQVFQPAPANTRKVILSTNIAETSVTVPGVTYVIDTGLVKIKSYSEKSGLETLTVQGISKSSAKQRTGRAGREGPGRCFRLYTESAFDKMEEATRPEILRCDLGMAVLMLKARGEKNIMEFEFMDMPSRESLIRAHELLFALGALDQAGEITTLGKEMSVLPLAPALSRTLLAAREANCVSQVIDIVACLSSEAIFVTPQGKRDEVGEIRARVMSSTGDHLTLLNVVRQYLELGSKGERRVWCERNFISGRGMKTDVRKQLQEYCQRFGIDSGAADDSEKILRCFLSGFSSNTALLQADGSYKTVQGQIIHIHPGSTMFGKKVEAIVFSESVYTTRAYVRNVSGIQAQWLQQVIGHYLRQS